MLFDPDKLDDNDPRKIAFLKQQEDQRQRAQKQPVDQENSDKVRPNPNAIATITPMKSTVVASNGNGDEDPNAIATITPTKSAAVASNGNGDEEEEKVHPLNNPVFNEYVEQQQKADQEASPKESTTVSNSLKRFAVTSSPFINNDERNNKRLKQNVTDSTCKDSPVPEEPPKVDIVKDGTKNAETLALASLSCADNIQSYWRTISLLIDHRGKHLTLLELNFPPMSSCTDTYMSDLAVPAILMSFISMPIRTASTILETLTSIQMFPMYRM